MKFATYNLLNGAPETYEEVVSAVKNISPDFLTLNEANTFSSDNGKILKDFACKTGYEFYNLSLSGEYDYHVAVFSKYPLKIIKEIKPLMRAGILSVIGANIGDLSIISTHLTPYTEDLRLPEIGLIMNKQKKYKHKLLMGDMNSLALYDGYDEKMIKSFNDIQLKKFTTNGKLRFDAINKILSHDYLDTAKLMGRNKISTAPTDINENNVHSNMRLDYIFISKSLKDRLISYEVIKNTLTKKISDHYPVVIELYLDK